MLLKQVVPQRDDGEDRSSGHTQRFLGTTLLLGAGSQLKGQKYAALTLPPIWKLIGQVKRRLGVCQVNLCFYTCLKLLFFLSTCAEWSVMSLHTVSRSMCDQLCCDKKSALASELALVSLLACWR